MRSFGTKDSTITYLDRPGAYIIPFKEDLIGVVRTPKGLFFIGGGFENSETDEECIQRECREETGYSVVVGEKIGEAETYCIHSEIGGFHPIQTYYMATLKEKVQNPTEQDHELIWMTYNELKGKMYSEMQNWALEHI